LLSTGVICVLVRVCVCVSLVFLPVARSARGYGRDVLLFAVGVGAGAELWRRLWCPPGCYCALPRAHVPRVSMIR